MTQRTSTSCRLVLLCACLAFAVTTSGEQKPAAKEKKPAVNGNNDEQFIRNLSVIDGQRVVVLTSLRKLRASKPWAATGETVSELSLKDVLTKAREHLQSRFEDSDKWSVYDIELRHEDGLGHWAWWVSFSRDQVDAISIGLYFDLEPMPFE